MSNRIHVNTRSLYRIAGSAVTAATLLAAAAPATANAAYPGLADWLAGDPGEHFLDASTGLKLITAGIEADNYPLLRKGCAVLHDALTIDLRHHLPTPDPALTAALQAMINDTDTATHICVTLTPSSSPSDFAAFGSFIQQANDHLKTADAIMDADLAP